MQLPNKVSICCLCWLLLGGLVYAASISFDPAEVGIGARPLALGKAYVGQADDASSIFLNPAGLSSQNKLQFVSMYSQLFQSESYLTLGIANTFHFGTLGLGYINVSSPNIEVVEFVGGIPTVTGYTSFRSGAFFLTYSRKVSEKLQIGGNLKLYTQGFSGGGATYEALSGSGMDADLGIKFNPSKWFSLGLAAQSFVPSSMGGKFTWNSDAPAETIPSLVKAGVSAKLFGEQAWREWERADITLLYDYDYSLSTDNLSHIGLEVQPVAPFTLRLGSDNGRLAAGIGFSYEDFTFDYAYRRLEGASENISHAFSVGYLGGSTQKGAIETVIRLKKQKEKRKVDLLLFTDVPRDHYAKGAIEKLAREEIIPGYADGSFKPEKKITRAALAMFLVRSRGIETLPVTQRIFKDIPENHWSASYVQAAVEKEWITGYPDATFRPNWPVTRAEMLVVLSRFDDFPKVFSDDIPFFDVPPEHWAHPVVNMAKERGMLGYIQADYFKPKQKVTRGEAAELLCRTQFVNSKIVR